MLGILRNREPAMLDLASHLKLEKSNVIGLISRAEKRRLVERTPPLTTAATCTSA
jgi:DNA-binding MarR family transcriptional regulator